MIKIKALFDLGYFFLLKEKKTSICPAEIKVEALR